MKWQLILVTVLLGCNSPGPALSATSTEVKFDQGHVTFHLAESDLKVQVEVARTGAARRQGLMNRTKLKPHNGMIFLFENEEPQSFWMKNTLLSLDMIFINQKGIVIGIVHNAEPMTTTPRNVPGISQYVVEMVGGYARQYGIEKGTQVTLGPMGKPLP
jgi:uncharacterized protein